MLSINISELVLTVLNFFLLFFVLDRLLFKPLIRFMDARQSRIDAGLEKERAAQKSVLEDKERNESLEAEARRQAELRLQQTRAENQLRRQQLLAQLRQEDEERRKALKADVEHFEDEERAELAAEDDELAGLLAARLLKESV